MTGARERFLSLFPKIADEMVGVLAKEGMPKDAQDWYRRSLDYNTPGGKLNRGMSVVDTVQILQGKNRLDDAEYEKAATLGWCIELVSGRADERASGRAGEGAIGSLLALLFHLALEIFLK